MNGFPWWALVLFLAPVGLTLVWAAFHTGGWWVQRVQGWLDQPCKCGEQDGGKS